MRREEDRKVESKKELKKVEGGGEVIQKEG